jgi:hypothetical protein
VHRLNFGLPPIARFEEGLVAVKAALERKTKATVLPRPDNALRERIEAKAGDDAGAA